MFEEKNITRPRHYHSKPELEIETISIFRSYTTGSVTGIRLHAPSYPVDFKDDQAGGTLTKPFTQTDHNRLAEWGCYVLYDGYYPLKLDHHRREP